MKSELAEQVIHEKDMYIGVIAEQDIVRTYEHERLYMQRVREGDVERIQGRRDGEEIEMHMGRLTETPKHFEHMVCAAVTLATHAAIDGGLNPASAYAMNDLYLRRLELCSGDMAAMGALYDEIELVFAQQVSLARQKRSEASYVEKCKLFIDQHLVKPFTLDDIASALNINKSYLSRRFAQEVGMRIMEYTRNKRIEAAAHMLKYSDKTISAIAANFCFPTQSYFGTLFKDIKGITPLKYRTANQVIEVRKGEQRLEMNG